MEERLTRLYRYRERANDIARDLSEKVMCVDTPHGRLSTEYLMKARAKYPHNTYTRLLELAALRDMMLYICLEDFLIEYQEI